MKSSKHTANGKKPTGGRRNPVVRELVVRPKRNAGRHKDKRNKKQVEEFSLPKPSRSCLDESHDT